MVCPSRKISKLAEPCLFDLNRAKRKTVHPDGRHLLILLWSLLPFGLFLEKRMCYFEQTDSFCLLTWLVDLVERRSLPFWCETLVDVGRRTTNEMRCAILEHVTVVPVLQD